MPELLSPETSAADLASPSSSSAAPGVLDEDRDGAQKALAIAVARRADLLRAGAPDADIELAEAEIRRAQRALGRAEFQQSARADEAEALRMVRTEAEFVAFYDDYKAASGAFLDALGDAISKRKQLMAVIAEGERRFPGRCGAYVAFPGEQIDLSDDQFDLFRRAAEAALKSESRRRKGEW